MEKNDLMYIPTWDDEIVWETNDIDKYHWVENHSFNGWLTVDTYRKQQDGEIKYIFKSHDGTKHYEAFVEDLLDMMKHMDDGKVAGSFEFVKHGNNYGIKLIHPATK